MRKELSLINKCKSWKECNQHIAKLTTGRQAKLGGSVFECVVKLYLQTEPKYQTKFKKVWLLDEVPYKIKKYLNLPRADEGIDLIVKTNEDEYWSVQAKYRSDINETLIFGGAGGLSTFQSLSFVICKNIKHGLVCATVNKPPYKKHLLKNIGYEVADTWISLDDNDNAAWKRIKLKAKGKTLKVQPAKPLKHQKTAILKAKEHFINKKNSRGKLIMPCGTGKSLAAYWIAQELKAKKLIIAVPSIALIKQTLNVWANETILHKRKIEWLCVCSDETVDSDQDEIVSSTSDLGIKPTTNQKEIERFIKRKTNNLKIIFTTYQSGQVTAKAARKTKSIFDLGLFDEAHKTVGHKDKQMAHLLLQKNIKIKKRLFMTATERIFRMNKDEYLSMDDPRDYGNIFYQLSFKKAIKAKPPIIADYKVITFSVEESDIERLINSNEFVRVRKEIDNITARELAVGIAIRKALKEKKIKNALTFHSSIKRAENFTKQQNLISKIYPKFGKLDTFHVSGKMSASERAVHLKDFGNSRKSLMTNARCLTEGIDMPSIDCVCFTDPKRSRVDIVQATGRAFRLSKGKRFGYVMIPIIVPKNKNLESISKNSSFEEIIQTVGALSQQDERIAEQLRLISSNKKPSRNNPISELINIKNIIRINKEKFEKEVKIKIWNKIAHLNYRSYSDAKNYLEKFQFSGVNNYKKAHSKNLIPVDIPYECSVIYKDQGWEGWRTFLGNDFISFEEARKLVISKKLNKMAEYLPLHKDRKFPDMPVAPDGVYKEWKSWRHFLGKEEKNFVNYDTAKKVIHKFRLKKLADWNKFVTDKKRPVNIPGGPSAFYKNKGWVNWGDFLGTGRAKIIFENYEKTKSFAHKLKLTNNNQWVKLHHNGKIPKKFPISVDVYFKKTGDWEGWPVFLGKKKIQHWRQFAKAKKFIQSLNIKSIKEFIDLKRNNKIPEDIPANPNAVYKNHGWKSFSDFLGNESIDPRLMRKLLFANFSEARKFARKLQFKSGSEWARFAKTSKKPKNIPSNVKYIYAKQWKGWADFLDIKDYQYDIKFYNYDVAKRKVAKKMIKNPHQYILLRKKDKRFPSRPPSHYKKQWEGWNIFLGVIK